MQSWRAAGCALLRVFDVPPEEGTLAVNFGKLLERWTGARIEATEHRVIGSGQPRRSIPFFYEPRTNAVIAPLPLPGVSFEPFQYGDYLWSTMTKFVEFHGLEGLRRPQSRRRILAVVAHACQKCFSTSCSASARLTPISFSMASLIAAS